MMYRTGKRAAVASGLLAVAICLVSAIVLRERILEEWYFRAGDPSRPEEIPEGVRIAIYRRRVAELEDACERHRRSSPIYERLDRAFRSSVIPLMKRAELGRLRMAAVFPGLPSEEQGKVRERYGRFDEERAIATLLGAVYADLARAVRSATTSQNDGRILDAILLLMRGGPVNPLEFEPPFPEGSLERDIFFCNLKEPLYATNGAICQALKGTLPEELKEKERNVLELHALLISNGSIGGEPVPAKYEYWASMEKALKEVDGLADSFWEEQKRGRRPPDEILADIARREGIAR